MHSMALHFIMAIMHSVALLTLQFIMHNYSLHFNSVCILMALQLITCAVWLERSGHGIIARRRSRGREGSAVADEDAMATLHDEA